MHFFVLISTISIYSQNTISIVPTTFEDNIYGDAVTVEHELIMVQGRMIQEPRNVSIKTYDLQGLLVKSTVGKYLEQVFQPQYVFENEIDPSGNLLSQNSSGTRTYYVYSKENTTVKITPSYDNKDTIKYDVFFKIEYKEAGSIAYTISPQDGIIKIRNYDINKRLISLTTNDPSSGTQTTIYYKGNKIDNIITSNKVNDSILKQIYIYDDNNFAHHIDFYENNVFKETKYCVYKLDDKGNWTERKLIVKDSGYDKPVHIEKRIIKYRK